MKVYIVQEFFDKDFWFPVFRVCDSLELAKKEADIAGKYDDYAEECIEGIWKKEFSESRGTRWVKKWIFKDTHELNVKYIILEKEVQTCM